MAPPAAPTTSPLAQSVPRWQQAQTEQEGDQQCPEREHEPDRKPPATNSGQAGGDDGAVLQVTGIVMVTQAEVRSGSATRAEARLPTGTRWLEFGAPRTARCSAHSRMDAAGWYSPEQEMKNGAGSAWRSPDPAR